MATQYCTTTIDEQAVHIVELYGDEAGDNKDDLLEAVECLCDDAYREGYVTARKEAAFTELRTMRKGAGR